MSESEIISPELASSDATTPEPGLAASQEEAPLDRRTELVQKIWNTLEGPWLFGAVGFALLLLYSCTILLQQMPRQLQEDPTGARRWALQTSEHYGLLGNVFRALGLFNVLNSPLLQLLLIALALIILIGLGNQAAKAWRLYHMPRYFATAKTSRIGAPLPVPAIRPVYRLRQVVDGESVQWKKCATETLQRRFEHVDQATVTVTNRTVAETGVAEAGAENDETEDNNTTAQYSSATSSSTRTNEIRLLAYTGLRFALLRPVFYLGLFLGLITIWIIVLWGWQVKPDPLPPGADYRSASQGLVLHYEVADIPSSMSTVVTTAVPSKTNSTSVSPIAVLDGSSQVTTSTMAVRQNSELTITQPTLVATVRGSHLQAPLGETIRLQWGQTVITSKAGPPALFLRTVSNAPLLSRLGQSPMVPSMGLLFPSPGSEEAIVVAQALGLRIVRLPSQDKETKSDQFLAEVYDPNNALIKRIPIQATLTTELTVEDRKIAIEFILVPGMVVEVAHRPAMWLFWPALLLTLCGLAGYLQRPAFVLLQLVPWPVNRTVVIVQSDEDEELHVAQAWLGEAQP